MRAAADTVPSTRASSSVPVPAGDGADDLAARIRDPGVTGRAGREAAEVMQDDDGAVLMGDDRVGDGADERGAGTSPAAGPSTPTSANIDASTRAGAGPPTAWTARTALGQALARARSTDRRRSSGPPSQARRSAGATRSRARSAPGRARRVGRSSGCRREGGRPPQPRPGHTARPGSCHWPRRSGRRLVRHLGCEFP